MRILIAGAHGAVGNAAAAELGKRHTIVTLGRSKGDVTADLMKPESITAMFAKAGKFDAIVSCTGHTYFGPLATMTPTQFMSGVNDKLMGQVNLVLEGLKHIARWRFLHTDERRPRSRSDPPGCQCRGGQWCDRCLRYGSGDRSAARACASMR